MNTISKNIKNIHHIKKQRQNNSEVNSNILRVQQDTNESNETTVKETGGYDKNSVRKDIIHLKNDIQEIKEALKGLLTKQWQSKHEQEILYQGKKKPIVQDSILKVITQKK